MEKITFHCVDEARPGPQFKAHFNRQWPRYAPWYFDQARGRRPSPQACRDAFEQAMPQMVPFLDQMAEGLPADHGELLQFLTLYQPPAFLTGCSQLACQGEGAYLIRNYDYAPDRFAGTVMRTCFVQPVLFMVDCVWGALDGINAAGLAVSLAFGGEPVVGPGFGIPIIVRYLLETCNSVEEAIGRLATLPSHMCYNLTMADAGGATASVYLYAGDRPPERSVNPVATNHQVGAFHRPYHHAVASFDREHFLINRLRDPQETVDSLTSHFLGPPLYCVQYKQGFGTLYTARYDCKARTLTLYWPKQSRVFSLDGIGDASFDVDFPGLSGSGV